MKEPFGPCKGCTFETGRTIEPNCHMTCERYLKYQEEHEKWKEKMHRERDKDTMPLSVLATRDDRFPPKP